MKMHSLKNARYYLFVLLFSLGYAPIAGATSDVESPHEQLRYLRVLLNSNSLLDDIKYYADQGCVWESETIWFGSLVTIESGQKLRFGGITIVFSNHKNDKEQLSHFFRLTETDELYDSERNAESQLQLLCDKS